MPLFKMFNNKLDNLFDSFDKEDLIYYCQNKNAINLQLLSIKRNKVINFFKIEK